MGVVRYETLDTLENRVLKQYLRYCFNESKRYLQKYDIGKYKESTRCKLVRKFKTLVERGLRLPEFEEVRNLSFGIPTPNYTLQNNRLYRVIWQHYQRLVRHISEIELLWRNRQELFFEVTKLLSMAVVDHNIPKDGFIRHELWMNQYPTGKGTFCVNPQYVYFEISHKVGMSFRILDHDGAIEIKRKRFSVFSSATMRQIHCYFIPETVHEKTFELAATDNVLIYAENQDVEVTSDFCKVVGSKDENFVIGIFSALRTWYEENKL